MKQISLIRQKLAIAVAYFLIYVVWGSTYYFIGVALRDIPTFLLGALRFSLAGILLLIICACRGEKVMRWELLRQSAVSGIVLLFVDMAVIMLAQRYVSSSLVAIVASSTALWIMLLDIPMWKKNFKSFRMVAGMLIGFSGVGMLYVEQLFSDTTVFMHNEYGIIILISGCISWALGTLYTKYRSSEVEGTHAFAGAAWQMIFASIMFWICSFVLEDYSQLNIASVRTSAWLSLVYLILFGSLLAYTAYVWLLKVRPASEVATHAYVNPVIAVLIGTSLGHEHVTVLQLVGLIIIIISLLLVEWPVKPKNIENENG